MSASATGLLYQLPWQWTDSEGRAVQLRQFAGTPTVLTMAYGACKKICSTSLYKMEQMQASADRDGQLLNFVVVSLDPSKDTPEDWRAFRQERKLTRSNWRFLSGTPKDIQSLAGNLSINYWIYHDHVLHDFGITLLDAEGNIVRKMQFADDNPVEFLQMKKASKS